MCSSLFYCAIPHPKRKRYMCYMGKIVHYDFYKDDSFLVTERIVKTTTAPFVTHPLPPNPTRQFEFKLICMVSPL